MNRCFAKFLMFALICPCVVDWAIAKPEFIVAQGLTNKGKAAPKTRTRPLTPQEQAEVLLDVKGLWAETAISALVASNIMPAFSDSTFRPNELVTQAQFQSVLVKAFPRSGYTVNASNQKITRSQAIVAVVKALNLRPSSTNLDNTFIDTAKISASAMGAIATAKSQKLLFSYPDIRVLNPNEKLSRIDLAALIYQALVIQGKLPPLPNSDVAQIYLVRDPSQAIAQINNINNQVNTPPSNVLAPPVIPPKYAGEPEAVRKSLRITAPKITQFAVATKSKGSPSISLTVPTGFGASAGNAFIGAGYQSSTRVNDGQDAGFSVGIGLGDPRELLGFEFSFVNFAVGTRSSLFENGGFNFKLHRMIDENTSIAIGVESAFTYGDADATSSVYGAISSILQLNDSPEQPFSSIGFTLGVGGGRFRSISDINTLQGTVNVFGSVAVRVLEPVSLIADWNGQTLSLGASFKPFRDIPLVITPGLTDIVGDNTNGTRFNGLNGLRFTLGVGYGIYF
jgi:hypothetical protein